MAKYDWSQFKIRINIKCSISRAYKSWATRRGMEQWFLKTCEFYDNDKLLTASASVQKENTYRWLWHGYSDEVEEIGEIIKTNGKDELQFTFAGNCLVTVKIYPYKKETIVELWQQHIPTNEQSKVSYHLGCSTGWTFYLANLKSVLEGGLDLRNKDVRLQHVINS